MIDLRDNVKTVELFTVNITGPEPDKPSKNDDEEKKKEVKSPVGTKNETGIDNDGWREETVELGSHDVKYAAYLAKIKKKILRIWKYPEKAYENNEEGNVIVKMSIDANGSLAQTILISSSGSLELDADALNVVKTAAPFEPLPENYSLSRLHIVASFRYKIRD
jgi:TonB family C-terminal domain